MKQISSPSPSGATAKCRKPVGRPRSDGRAHLTRERVFRVCSKLIAKHGYAGTGIRTMASALQASPASLFNLFGSKDGLLSELITYAAQPSLEFYKELEKEDATPTVKLFKIIYEEVIAVASADQDYAALFYLPELRKPELKAAQEIRCSMIAHYQNLIVLGVAAGELTTENVALSAEQIFQLTETSIIGGPAMKKIKPKELASLTAKFCLRSLLIEPGRLRSLESKALKIDLRIELPNPQ